MFETKTIRSRYNKTNPADFTYSNDNFQPNDIRLIARNKHNKTQIIFMSFTALFYFIYTLRAYIPTTNSHFWSNLAIRPITRVYTTDLRPSIITENLLLRLAENWQTFWLIYILSYIPRRTNLGYLYRNPDIFNSFLCFLLISALALQTLSQSSLSPEVSCACLCVSLILLIISCRIVAIKSHLLKYENKYRSAGLSIDLMIIHYFVLNSLFIYTTSIAYSTICAIVEYIGIYLDPNATLPKSIDICTTIGLLIIFILIFIYFLFDQFIYENEFWSIWTPYLFIVYAFICPPLRQLSLVENDFNYYLLWALFCFTILIIFIRLIRQISIKYRQKKKKIRISSHIEQITSGT